MFHHDETHSTAAALATSQLFSVSVERGLQQIKPIMEPLVRSVSSVLSSRPRAMTFAHADSPASPPTSRSPQSYAPATAPLADGVEPPRKLSF
jgi:hypothetical protein